MKLQDFNLKSKNLQNLNQKHEILNINELMNGLMDEYKHKMNKIIITSDANKQSISIKAKKQIKIMKRQTLTESHIITPSFQNPKQSRLYVKEQQIRRKVSKIETREQLQKVYRVMKSQNGQLVKDVTVLKQHLGQVEEKKKIQGSRISTKVESSVAMMINSSDIDLSQSSPQLVTQYQTQKNLLQQQYKLMHYLKSTISQLQKDKPTQEVTQHQLNKKNKLKEVQAEMISEKRQVKLLMKEGEQLELTMRQNERNDNVNYEAVRGYEQENGELRRRISEFRQEEYRNQYRAVSVIDQIYKKKQILTQYQAKPHHTLLNTKLQNPSNHHTFFKRTKSVSNHLTNPSNYQSTPNNPNIKDNPLTQQVIELKQQVQQLSLEQLKRKEQQKKQKEQLIESTKRLSDKFKELERLKTKKAVELNHLKAKVQIMMKEKQLRDKNKIITNNFGTQSDGFSLDMITQPLRRDFIGIVGQKARFDDRIFLKQKKRTFIKGIIVYQNDNNLSAKGSIVAIRAIYTDAETNQFNFIPLPGQYLQKCKMQRLQLPEDDFLKLIKVKYNNVETRVTKIEIRSNRNLKYEFGEKRPFQQVTQNESVYAFDIGLNEFPVSVFGSFCQFRNCWYLESFGVEINTLT